MGELGTLPNSETDAVRNRSLGRSILSTGRHNCWNTPSGSLGVRSVRNDGNPSASMLLARMSSAALLLSGWLVISQCSFFTLVDARYGIIHRVKESDSGISGGKDCTSEKVDRDRKLEKIRASAGNDVSGVWRRTSFRRGWLLDRVANDERPFDEMPRIFERVKLRNAGRERRLVSLKAFDGRLHKCRCCSDGRTVSVLASNVPGARVASGRHCIDKAVSFVQPRCCSRNAIS